MPDCKGMWEILSRHKPEGFGLEIGDETASIV
jgi:hypothetical protein